MDELKPIPKNAILGAMSALMGKGKEVLNWPGKLPDSVPFLGGKGAGDLVFGEGPELLEDMSYGSPPYRGSGWATRVDPRTIDLAFAPGVGTLAATTLRGGKAIPKVVAKAATNEGRRDFLKKAAGAATLAATPDVVTKILREAPIATTVAKEAVPSVVVQAARTAWTPELMKEALPHLSNFFLGGEDVRLTNDIVEALQKRYPNVEDFKGEKAYFDIWDEPPYMDHDTAKFNSEVKLHPKYKEGEIFHGLDSDEYYDLHAKYNRPNKEYTAWENARSHLESLPQEELDRIIKLGPQNFPDDLSKLGITPQHVVAHRYPVMGEELEGANDLIGLMNRQLEDY